MVLNDSRNFRLLWSGQFVSVIGDGMQRIALLWWAKQRGGNGLLAVVALCSIVPVVAGSPVGGWLADRYDRRVLLVSADLLRMCTTALLAVALLTGHGTPWLVCAVLVLSAFCTAVFDPAYAAAVPTVVEAAQLPAANGLNMANGAVGGLVGPMVGGVLIGLTGVGEVMVINAATFMWSAVFVALTRLPRPAGASATDSERVSSREALSTVAQNRDIRRLVGLAAVLNMVVAPAPLMIAALAVDRFRTGSVGFGVLEVMVSVGLLIGSLAAGKLARGSIGTPMLVAAAALAVTGSLPLVAAAVGLVVVGVSVATTNAVVITRFQTTVPAEVQGRVFGVVGALGEGLRPAGLALGPALLAVAGVSGSFIVVGVGMALATLAWARPVATKAVPADRLTEPVLETA